MIRNGKLEIFENFWVDDNLKKNKTTEAISSLNGGNFIISAVDGIPPSRGFVRSEDVQLREYLEYVYSQNRTVLNWIKLKLTSALATEKMNKPVKGKIKFESVDVFFNNIKNAVSILEIDPSTIEFYTEAIAEAFKNGQIALAEILSKKKETVIRELNLVKIGVTKYVDEEDIVKFHELGPKGSYLKLTWMRNYVRIIPKEVLERKKEFDEKEAFDNYVILHFDKNDDSSQMTEKQKEKAKDPILFGVISGSRKLFYVGDWVDEYCDLTLKEFLKTMEQKKPKELSQEIIKKEILNGK